MYQERIKRVLDSMEEMGLDQMLVSDPDSIWYLTGYDVFPFERLFAFYLRRLTVSILRHTLFSRKGPAKYSFDISLAEIRCFHFCDQPFSCLIGIMWQLYQNPTLLKKFPEPFRSGKIIGLRF